MIGTCRLCTASEVKLVKSHIIPKALYGDLLSEDPRGPMKLVPLAEDKHAQTSRIGVYDRILCEKCEGRIALLDDYAIQILRDTEPSDIVASEAGKTEALIYDNIDTRMLLLYSVSLLWRGQVATHPFFNDVRIGPYEERCRTALLDEDLDPVRGIDACFARFDDEQANGFLNPYREELEGVNVYRFFAAKLTHLIKVDSRPFSHSFRHYSLRNSNKLVMLNRKYQGSPEHRMMVRIARSRPTLYGK